MKKRTKIVNVFMQRTLTQVTHAIVHVPEEWDDERTELELTNRLNCDYDCMAEDAWERTDSELIEVSVKNIVSVDLTDGK
jgi:hypothetical protein